MVDEAEQYKTVRSFAWNYILPYMRGYLQDCSYSLFECQTTSTIKTAPRFPPGIPERNRQAYATPTLGGVELEPTEKGINFLLG